MLLGKIQAKSMVVFNQNNGRRIAVSHITIKAGDVILARASFGGNWSDEQALKEYYRLPKRFTAA